MVIGDEDHRDGATEAGIKSIEGSADIGDAAECDEERARSKLNKLKVTELKALLQDTIQVKFRSNSKKSELQDLIWKELLGDTGE